MDAPLVLFLGTAFLAAFVSGMAGFALGLIAAGPFLLLFAPAEATALVLAMSVANQSLTIRAVRGAVRWPRLWPFLLGGALGIPLGMAVLARLDAGPLRIAIGAFLLGYSLYLLLRATEARIAWGGRAADAGAGFLGGAMAAFGGMSGPIPVLWCALRGWPAGEQRAVFQPYLLFVQTASLIWLWAAIGVESATALKFLYALPGQIAGALLGARLYRRIDAARFRKIVLGLLFASGAALFFTGFAL